MSYALERIEHLAYELEVTKRALAQARERELQYGNTMGRIACLVAGGHNNISDEACIAAIAGLAKVSRAAAALAAEGEEYALDSGLCRAAPNSYWEDLDAALEEAEFAMLGIAVAP